MFIKLTEITKSGGEMVERPALFNPAFIVGISTGPIAKESVPIIGQELEMVSMVQISVGKPILVRESMEDIEAMLDSVELLEETGRKAIHGAN